MWRKNVLVVVFGFVSMHVFAQISEAGVPLDATNDSPSLGTRIGNIFAPGLIQVEEGDQNGYWYMPGTALLITGSVLQTDYLLSGGSEDKIWASATGWSLADAGASLTSYTGFDFERKHRDKLGKWSTTRPVEPYLNILSAPYQPENILDPEIILPLGLMIRRQCRD